MSQYFHACVLQVRIATLFRVDGRFQVYWSQEGHSDEVSVKRFKASGTYRISFEDSDLVSIDRLHLSSKDGTLHIVQTFLAQSGKPAVVPRVL